MSDSEGISNLRDRMLEIFKQEQMDLGPKTERIILRLATVLEKLENLPELHPIEAFTLEVVIERQTTKIFGELIIDHHEHAEQIVENLDEALDAFLEE